MTNEELMKNIRYYKVLVTGAVIMTAANPLIQEKDTDGKLKIKWMRDSNPSAELKAVGLGDGRFFQCEFIEINTVAASLTLPGGGTAELGPLTSRGVPRNLFERQQREPFNAIALKIIGGEYKIIKEAVTGDKPVAPVLEVLNFAMPGQQRDYSVGFEYYLHRRDRTTHKETFILAWQYKDGKLVQDKVIRTTAQIFLFGNELETANQLITDAIAAHTAFKVPAASGVRETHEDVRTSNEPSAQKEVQTV
jgi:hypothetical protein